MVDIKEMQSYLIEGKEPELVSAVGDALSEGIEPKYILDNVLIAGMRTVGDKFEAQEFYLPEMMLSAVAMKSALKIIEPILKRQNIQSYGKIVIGTVEGDTHDLGKNLVASMLQGAGFEIIDLGIDVSTSQFVQHVKENKPDVLALSCLLTTTMKMIPETLQALKSAGLRDEVKVIIGGAPVTEEFAVKSGADGYAEDAFLAVNKVEKFLGIVNGQR
ncbi:MAG: corrinoid protein [Actinobacteria bacterium]|nr:corrinoid protein [Actinomycetota bacterium]